MPDRFGACGPGCVWSLGFGCQLTRTWASTLSHCGWILLGEMYLADTGDGGQPSFPLDSYVSGVQVGLGCRRVQIESCDEVQSLDEGEGSWVVRLGLGNII